jgi:membrane-bound inhibitor of C-type lysozyme
MTRIPIASLLLATLLAGTGCQRQDVGTPAAAPQNPAPPSDSLSPPTAPSALAATLRYHCDGLDFTAQYVGDQVIVQTPDRRYALPQVRAADGAKFQDGATTFWSKGETAIVELDGKPYTNCRERLASEAPPAP